MDPSNGDLSGSQGLKNMGEQNCFECGYNMDGSANGVSLYNQSSNSFEDTMYEMATKNLHNSTSEDGEDIEHSELYVIPWSLVILWCFLYGGISVAALIGNTLVMWVVAISRTMRTVTNMFIANLALADFIIALFTIPFQFQAALLQRWNLPDFMCAFCPFVQVLSVNVSVFTLSAIAVDRYRAVLYPLSPRVSKRKATWAIVTIWSMSILIALPTELDYKVTLYNDTEKGEIKPFCSNAGLSVTLRMYYSLSLLVIQYIFPLIILTGAYAHMTTILWGTTVPGNKEESRDAVVLRNKKRVIKMLMLVLLMFSICWLPIQMYNVLQIFIPSINKYKYINILWFCFHWLAMSNSCCNPFIYAIYNDKFQREFRTRLGYICIKHRHGRHDDPDCTNFSDASEMDGAKVRASYKFKNNLSVRYNHQNVFNNENEVQHTMTTKFNQGESCAKRSKSIRDRRHSCQSRQGSIMKGKSKGNAAGGTGNSLTRDNLVIRNGAFMHPLVKSIKEDGENVSKLSAGTQIAVVCPNTRPSINSSMATITVVAHDAACQL